MSKPSTVKVDHVNVYLAPQTIGNDKIHWAAIWLHDKAGCTERVEESRHVTDTDNDI